jgi:hypothetical protein
MAVSETDPALASGLSSGVNDDGDVGVDVDVDEVESTFAFPLLSDVLAAFSGRLSGF